MVVELKATMADSCRFVVFKVNGSLNWISAKAIAVRQAMTMHGTGE